MGRSTHALPPEKSNLAGTYGALGWHGEALELRLEVAEFRQRVLGEEHPDTAASKLNTSTTVAHLGQFALAEQFARGAISIQMKCLPAGHPNLQIAMEVLRNIQAARNSSTMPQVRNAPKAKKIAANAPCPCGSGKKYKKCKCAQYH